MKQLKTSKDLIDNIGKRVRMEYSGKNIEGVLTRDSGEFMEVSGKYIHLVNFDNDQSRAKDVFLIDNVTEKEVATPKRLKQHDDYKVGDKVRIRKWDDMKAEFGVGVDGSINCNQWFTTRMQEFCGKTLTISTVMPDSFYVKETPWSFSTDMFEKEYIEPINTYSQPPETNMPDRLYGSKPTVATYDVTPPVITTPSFDDIMKANAMLTGTAVSYDWGKPVLGDITVTTSSSCVPKTGGTPKSTQFKILTFKKY